MNERHTQRRTRQGVRRGLVALLTTGTLLLAGCGNGGADASGETTTFSGAVVDADKRYVPSALPLASTTGGERTLAGDADLTLVFFGYTHCPDICGAVLSNIASAMNRLSDAERERVEVLFVTTDPARDDVKTLRAYLNRYDPEFVGLTGDLDDLSEVGESMKVYFAEGTKLPSGGYEVEHNDHVVGIDSEGLGAVVWTRETSSATLASDVKSMLAD